MRPPILSVLLFIGGCNCAASHTARSNDAAADVLAPIDSAGPLCAAPDTGTSVSGMTPLGVRSFDYSFVGNAFWSGHDCYDLRLGLGIEPDVEATYEPWDGLEISASNVAVEVGVTIPVNVSLREAGMEVSTTGTVIIDSLSTATLTAAGTLQVFGGDWSLSGTFDATHCVRLDDVCI